jgi:hypothetical protein
MGQFRKWHLLIGKYLIHIKSNSSIWDPKILDRLGNMGLFKKNSSQGGEVFFLRYINIVESEIDWSDLNMCTIYTKSHGHSHELLSVPVVFLLLIEQVLDNVFNVNWTRIWDSDPSNLFLRLHAGRQPVRTAGHPLASRSSSGKQSRAPRFYPVVKFKFNYILIFHFSTLWFYSYDFKLKKQFTHTPLCDINGVKYDTKR